MLNKTTILVAILIISLSPCHLNSQDCNYTLVMDSINYTLSYSWTNKARNKNFLLTKEIEGNNHQVFKYDTSNDSLAQINTIDQYSFDYQSVGDGSRCIRLGKAYDPELNELFNGEVVDLAKEILNTYIIKDLVGEYYLVNREGERIRKLTTKDKLVKQFNNRALSIRGYYDSNHHVENINGDHILNVNCNLGDQNTPCGVTIFQNQHMFYVTKDYNEHDVYDYRGKLIHSKCKEVNTWYKECALIIDELGKAIIYNGNKQVKLKKSYMEVKMISDSLISIQHFNEKYGIVNENGSTILEPVYDKIELFNNKYLITSKRDEPFEIYDLKGHKVDLNISVSPQSIYGQSGFKLLDFAQTHSLIVYPSQNGELVFNEEFKYIGQVPTDPNSSFYKESLTPFRECRMEYLDLIKHSNNNTKRLFYYRTNENTTLVFNERKEVVCSNLNVHIQLSSTTFLVKTESGYSIVKFD